MEKETSWIRKSLEHSSEQHMLLTRWSHPWYSKYLMVKPCQKETMHTVRGSLWFLSILAKSDPWSGPYEILDELHMDNLDKSSLESNSIEEKHDFMMMPSTWSHKVSNPSWAKGICLDRGRWYITWRNTNTSIMDHIARRNSTMAGGVTYLWRTTIHEEKKQLDRESIWAPRFPLMSKGERD